MKIKKPYKICIVEYIRKFMYEDIGSSPVLIDIGFTKGCYEYEFDYDDYFIIYDTELLTKKPNYEN